MELTPAIDPSSVASPTPPFAPKQIRETAARCDRCDAFVRVDARFCRRCGKAYSVDELGVQPARTFGPQRLKVGAAGIAILSAVVRIWLVPTTQSHTAYAARPVSPAPVIHRSVPVTPSPIFAQPKLLTVTDKSPATRPAILAKPAEAPHAAPAPRPVLFKTAILGATTGGWPFEQWSHTGEPLLGFRLSMDRWDNRTIVRSLEPVWASDNLLVTPSMIVARPGYAVGGVIVDGDDHVTAMRVRFMRRSGDGVTDGLNTADTYDSPWFGNPSVGATYLLGGTGERVVGIYGRRGLNVDALGLILMSKPKP